MKNNGLEQTKEKTDVILTTRKTKEAYLDPHRNILLTNQSKICEEGGHENLNLARRYGI